MTEISQYMCIPPNKSLIGSALSDQLYNTPSTTHHAPCTMRPLTPVQVELPVDGGAGLPHPPQVPQQGQDGGVAHLEVPGSLGQVRGGTLRSSVSIVSMVSPAPESRLPRSCRSHSDSFSITTFTTTPSGSPTNWPPSPPPGRSRRVRPWVRARPPSPAGRAAAPPAAPPACPRQTSRR